jgi:hypothetical protein
MTATPLPTPSPGWARIADAFWVGLPLTLRRYSAGLAVSTVDGFYLAARPVLGAVVPVAAFVAGLGIGAIHPGFEKVFTEALWLLVLFAVVGALSGAAGLYMTVGFALGDLFVGDHPLWRSAQDGLLAKYGSWLLSYLLIAMLTVGVPIAAKSLAAEFRLRPSTPRGLRALVGLGAMVAITGLLVYAWVQSAPLLVRPVFVWADDPPTLAAIEPLQERGGWVVTFAILAAAARAVAQIILAGRVGQRDRMSALEDRFRTAEPVVPLLSRLPLPVRLVIRAAFLTLVLAGLYAAFWQALVTFGVLVAAQFLANLLSMKTENTYTRVVNKVPRLVRLLIAVIPVYLLGTAVLGYFISAREQSFLPFLIVTVVSAILMSLLSPARPDSRRESR